MPCGVETSPTATKPFWRAATPVSEVAVTLVGKAMVSWPSTVPASSSLTSQAADWPCVEMAVPTASQTPAGETATSCSSPAAAIEGTSAFCQGEVSCHRPSADCDSGAKRTTQPCAGLPNVPTASQPPVPPATATLCNACVSTLGPAVTGTETRALAPTSMRVIQPTRRFGQSVQPTARTPAPALAAPASRPGPTNLVAGFAGAVSSPCHRPHLQPFSPGPPAAHSQVLPGCWATWQTFSSWGGSALATQGSTAFDLGSHTPTTHSAFTCAQSTSPVCVRHLPATQPPSVHGLPSSHGAPAAWQTPSRHSSTPHSVSVVQGCAHRPW